MDNNIERELEEIEISIEKGDSDAVRRLEVLAAKHPKEPAIWAARAHFHSRQRDSTAAARAWSQAVATSDKEPHYYYMRGIALFRSGKYEDAVRDFSRVIELSDQHDWEYYREPAYFFRADSYVRLREFDKARSDCKHVSEKMRTWTNRLKCKEDILAECP